MTETKLKFERKNAPVPVPVQVPKTMPCLQVAAAAIACIEEAADLAKAHLDEEAAHGVCHKQDWPLAHPRSDQGVQGTEGGGLQREGLALCGACELAWWVVLHGWCDLV